MTSGLVLGPLVGGLSHNSVNLWARTDGPAMLYAWIGQQPDLRDARLMAASLVVASAGFAGRVAVRRLAPDTTYHYALTLSDQPPPPENGPYPAFTTAPPPETPADFAFAFGSCFLPGIYNDGATFRNLARVREQLGLRFLLMLGDQIYADAWWKNGIQRVALDEEDYRRVYLHTWGHPAWRETLPHIPVFMTMDDHEVDDDWAWSSRERYEGYIPRWHLFERLLRRLPAEARHLSHRRIQAAIQVYWEHQGMHAPPFIHPPEGVKHDRPLMLPGDDGHFAYTFTFGQAAFFVLDTRTQRVHGQRMLNRSQWEALENWLLEVKDRYPVKFIVSSVSVLFEIWGDFTRDRWNGYPDERRRLLHLLAANRVRNVFILTGDLHSAHAVEAKLRVPDGEPLTVWEFCASPFEQVPNKLTLWAAKKVKTYPIVDQKIHFRFSRPNFGVVRVNFGGGQPRVRYEIYGDQEPTPHHVAEIPLDL